ncbi:MAG: hypothetical protein COA79_21435 [Planctomycetota bacterium]|nr:MAG: hypothetical protein COA79_21435 [Planctomycetota bacterium]
MQSWKAEVFLNCENQLGEGPEWDPTSKIFSWVDIIGKSVHTYDFKSNSQNKIELDSLVGFAIPTDHENKYILGMLNQLNILDIKTKDIELFKTIQFDTKFQRLNDGKCDSKGRLWTGTQTSDIEKQPGSLYNIEKDQNIKTIFSDVGCSNGQCWSSDNKKMFYIDTTTLTLRSYDYEIETGDFSNETVILEFPKENGFLDGMTIDAEDKLWIALWNGSKVIRYCPITKSIIGEIEVDARQVTSMAFGGENLEKCFITTARSGIDESILKNQPNNGTLFICETKIPGKQNYKFKL